MTSSLQLYWSTSLRAPLQKLSTSLPKCPLWIIRWGPCLLVGYALPCTGRLFMMLAWRNSPFSKAIRYHDYAVYKLLPAISKGFLYLKDCGKCTFAVLPGHLHVRISAQVGVLWYGAWCSLSITFIITSFSGYLTRCISHSSPIVFTISWSQIMRDQRQSLDLLGKSVAITNPDLPTWPLFIWLIVT